MAQMECPYSSCGSNLTAGSKRCPQCQRIVKWCRKNDAPAQVFANFCPACGEGLRADDTNWPSFKGGPRRFGLNPNPVGLTFKALSEEAVKENKVGHNLGDRCTSLLAWDQHFVAISENGRILITDPVRDPSGRPSWNLSLDGPVTARPCIDGGVLFMPRDGVLAAYSLGALHLPTPRTEPRWQVALGGTPVQALLALEDRVFVNVLRREGYQTVVMADGSDDGLRKPPRVREIHRGTKIGWLAAEPNQGLVVFLSEESGRLFLHQVDASQPTASHTKREVLGAPLPLVEQVPTAVMGKRLFAVLGDDDNLCRLDLDGSVSPTRMDADVKRFSINSFQERVLVKTGGIHFPYHQVTSDLNPGEQVRGEPVVIRDCAAVVGFQNGRIHVYDLKNPPVHWNVRVSPDGLGVLCLASFGSYLAAGDSRGKIVIYPLLPKGYPSNRIGEEPRAYPNQS